MSLPLFERALQLRRGVLGEEHPLTLTSASHLAADLRALGQHEAAHRSTRTPRLAAGPLATDQSDNACGWRWCSAPLTLQTAV
ncbi:MAG: tetratricopeptide repeat protein [Pseudonocardiaceae bacterium]